MPTRIPAGITALEWAINRNASQSALFTSTEERMKRKLYRTQHPTIIVANKCMDGRLNMTTSTGIPLGIIVPMRTIGGKFDLGHPFYGEIIRDQVDYAVDNGRKIIYLHTYHFSASDSHYGCAGHEYSTENAIEGAYKLKRQFDDVFGASNTTVYSIVVGMETDQDGLIFHSGDQKIDLSNTLEKDHEEITVAFQEMYPHMSRNALDDLLQLVFGNRTRIREVLTQGREPIALNHAEQIIAVGRGFSWLHEPNRALIIGPYGNNWINQVAVQAKIIASNLEEKRINPAQRLLLLCTGQYRNTTGFERQLAAQKACYLFSQSYAEIERTHPELLPHLDTLVGVVNADTLLLEEVGTK